MLQPTASQSPKGLLPKGSRLQGHVLVAQGLRIEGEVIGDVRALESADGTVVVAEGALVHGALEAAHVVVHGQVQGPIVASQTLQIMAGAQIHGNLLYRHLTLHPDAVVRGSMSPMLGLPPQDSDAPPQAADAADDPAHSELDKGPNHDAGKPEVDLDSHEDAVPSRPNPA